MTTLDDWRHLLNGEPPMDLILLVVILIVLFGFGGGYYGYRGGYYGGPGFGIVGVIVLVLILLLLFGGHRIVL
jgi:hypothetical protein